MSAQRRITVIIAQILKLRKDGASRPRIMYKLNLDFKMGTRYLIDLMKKRFPIFFAESAEESWDAWHSGNI